MLLQVFTGLVLFLTPTQALIAAFENSIDIKSSQNKQHFNDIILEYENEIKKNPHNTQLILAVAEVYYALKEWGKAIDYYKQALQLEPDNLKIKTSLALAYLNNNEIKQSLALLEQVVKKDPENVEALGGLGRIAALGRHFQQAEFFYQKALALNPTHFTTLFYLGELRIEEKRYLEAQEILQRLFKRDTNAVWVQQALKRAELGPFLEKANELKEKGDYQAAIAIFKEQLSKNPNSELYLALANLYSEMKSYSKAIELLNEGIKLYPDENALKLSLGLDYVATNNLERATVIFENSLKNVHGQPEALAGLGRIAAIKGQLYKAEKLYQKSLALNPFSSLTLSYLAQLRMDQERYEEAQKLFEEIYRLNPKALWAQKAADTAKLSPILKMISQEEKQGNLEQTEQLFEQVLTEFPEDGDNYIRFAKFYRDHKLYPKAVEILRRGISVKPDYTNLYIALGHDLMLMGEGEQSLQALKTALNQEPSNPEVLAELGRLRAEIGDEEDAANLYKWALAANPHDTTALSYLIDLRLQQKQYDEAERLAKRVLKINPRAKWAKEILLKARFAPEFNEIEALKAAGYRQEAALKLEQLLEQAPLSEEAYLELGRSYMGSKRYVEAVKLYKKGLRLIPESSALLVDLGLAYIQLDELKKANTVLQKAFKLDHKNSDAIAALGKLALLQGNKEKAENLYQKALKLNPENILALSLMADLWMSEKQFDKAKQTYEKIVLIDPNAFWAESAALDASFAPVLEEGDEKEKSKQIGAAVNLYQNLIAEAPNKANYYIKLGNLYLKTKQYDAAIALYQSALQVLPDSYEINNSLGYAFLAKKDWKGALRVFERLLRSDSKNAEAIAGIGRLNELTGNKEQAIEWYQRALKVDPSNITALVYLSNLSMELGYYDFAQKLYKKIYRLQPNSDWIKLAIEDAKHGQLLGEIKTKEAQEDYRTVETLWQHLLTEEPNTASYYLRFGLFYHKIKEYDKAIDVYLQGLKIDPNSSDLYASLGLVYLSKKKLDDAKKAFKSALKIDSGNPDALAGLGYVALLKERYEEAEDLIKEALAIDPERIAALSAYGDLLVKEKRYPEAVEVYRKLLSLRPNEAWVKLSLDDAIYGPQLDQIKELILDEQFAEAAEIYKQLLEASPNNAHFIYGLGQMYMRLQEYGNSIRVNLEGLEKNPEENELRIALGYAYFFNNNLSQAREALTKALEIDAKNPEALAGLGRVEALDGNPCAAEDLYLRALSFDPKNLSAMSFYADLLMRQRRFDEAQAVLAGITRILPNAEWVKRSLQDAKDGPVTVIANELSDQEEFEVAADIYSKLICASPDDPARYLPLGQIYANLQQYCCALDVFNQALNLDPEAWYIWRAIGFTYILMEEFSAAQCIFEALLEQDPDDAESWAGLGRIQALNGSFCLAEEYFIQALSLSPKNLTALSFYGELLRNEEWLFSSLDVFETLYDTVESLQVSPCDLVPKWVVRNFNDALNLSSPILHVSGSYHEEDQWDPTIHRWSAEYQVYGGKALITYPLCDGLTVWGSFADQFYNLKDLINRNYLYSFDVQRFHVGARWVYNSCFYIDAKAGLTNYSRYRRGTFKAQSGTIPEPSLILTYHTPTSKATLGILSDSDLVARDFQRRVAKLVGYYWLSATYEWKVMRRTWAGFEADAFLYNDFVKNSSERVIGWVQWRPPYYSDNILFRYSLRCQTFAKNIPDYYTYKPQVVNQLQVTLEKRWRVCWADTFYTSLSYGHGWQNTRTRFSQIIVITPIPAKSPFVWDNRQFDIVFGTLIYKRGRFQFTFAGDYYRDTEKYTMWSVAADLAWRF